MGITSSNPYEPVVFDKKSGVHFRKFHPPTSSPLDITNGETQMITGIATKQNGWKHVNNRRQHNQKIYSREDHLSNGASVKCRNDISDWVHSDQREQLLTNSHCSGDYISETFINSSQEQDSFSQCDSLSYDGNPWNQDAESLQANFSFGSLAERNRRTEELLESRGSANPVADDENEDEYSDVSLGLFSDSVLPQFHREFSSESLAYFSDAQGPRKFGRCLRRLSIDSEMSDLSLDVHQSELEVGATTVAKMDQLQTQLLDTKQALLDLDADLVNLKVYKKAPKHGYELTTVSLAELGPPTPGDSDNSGLVDVVNLHKAKMWCRGLLDPTPFPKNNDCTKGEQNSDIKRPSSALDSMLSEPKYLSLVKELSESSKHNPLTQRPNGACVDSGSDFGNSLESDSGDNEVKHPSIQDSCPSLEWDSTCLPACECDKRESSMRRHSIDSVSELSAAASEPLPQSNSQRGKRNKLCRRHSSTHSSAMLKDQIQRVISSEHIPSSTKMRLVRSQTLPINEMIAEYNGELLESYQDENDVTVDSQLSSLKSFENQDLNDFSERSSLPMESVKSKLPSTDCSLRSPQDGGLRVIFPYGNTVMTEDPYTSLSYQDTNGNSYGTGHLMNRSANVNKESGYCESSIFSVGENVENIGGKMDFSDYASKANIEGEKTHKEAVKGYRELEFKFPGACLRKVRSDGYCAIRAALYQVLVNRLSVIKRHGGTVSLYQKFQKWFKEYPWLEEWSFAHRLPYTGNTCLQGFWDCLSSLENLEEELEKAADPVEYVTTLLNSSIDRDVQLMEAIKMLMFISAMELYALQRTDEVIPIFSLLLFSRETSLSPKGLLLNHLNRIGDDESLQQLELYLLGYTLGTTLSVYHPLLVEGKDFVSHYPDWRIGVWPEVSLIREEEQYFVITK